MKRLKRQFGFVSDEEVRDQSFLAPYYRRYNEIRDEMIAASKSTEREQMKARREELKRELEELWARLQKELQERKRTK